MQEYSMEQLINEPTNFTEHPATLIDLTLVRNDINILTSGVIDTFIPDQIRYHCPVIITKTSPYKSNPRFAPNI